MSETLGSNKNTIEDCKIIELAPINNRAGNICVISRQNDLPFQPKRVFYLYDIPAGNSRGAHAHKECHQFLVAASGSFDVEVDDGNQKKQFSLNRPFYGLYIPPGIWAYELNFSSGAICLVLASDLFDEADYIRNYPDYMTFKT